MARLTRKDIKVFAENATNNGVFGSLQANNPTTTSDVEQIQSLSAWGEGWNAATQTAEKLPPLEEMQGIQYVLSYQQAYIMQEGVPEWSTNVTYYKGSLVKEVTGTGFILYSSNTNNNKGYLPNNTTYWTVVFNSSTPYAFDSDVVHNTGNEDVSGIKDFNDSPLVPLPENDSNDKTAANTQWVTAKINSIDLIPKGVVLPFAGSTAPSGFLICDGSAISRTTYADLFAVIGTTYGTGDGSTTFNLPNLTDKFIQGSATVGTVKSAGLPNIIGTFKGAITKGSGYDADGCFEANNSGKKSYVLTTGTGQTAENIVNLNASRSSSIYGNSTTVQPPALTMLYCIKY